MTLMEMFVLAAIDNGHSIFYSYGTYMGPAVSGIAVIELIRKGRLVLEDGRLMVKETSPTGDELLDEVLQAVSAKGSARKLNSWIMSLPYKVKRFSKRLSERLEDDGILRIEQSRFLGLFPSRRYVVTNLSERDRIVNACREALLKGNRAPEYETMLILSVSAACGFAGKFFSKEELRGMKETFKQLRKGTFFETEGDVEKQVVVAIQRAVAATQEAAV